jgi:predicted alpha/beta-fold hydrolase
METSFRPLPWLSNPHVQTLLGNLLRGSDTFLPAVSRKVTLPNGDALAVHDTSPRKWRAGDPVALLVHGLGGSSRSGYMIRVADQLNYAGMRVLRLDLRGAGAGMRLSRKIYHGGTSADVRAVAEILYRNAPASPLYLAGFSLGGNVILKLAGEEAAQPLSNLHGVAAIAPPVDMVRCSELLFAQPFYDRYFARALQIQVQRHQRIFPDLPAVRFPKPLGMLAFDNLYTAPRNGFADAMDYYRRVSALPLLPMIRVPSFILSAKDDPFVTAAPLEHLPANKNLQIHILPHGGHLGFLGWDGAGGIRWAERQLANWIIQQI